MCVSRFTFSYRRPIPTPWRTHRRGSGSCLLGRRSDGRNRTPHGNDLGYRLAALGNHDSGGAQMVDREQALFLEFGCVHGYHAIHSSECPLFLSGRYSRSPPSPRYRVVVYCPPLAALLFLPAAARGAQSADVILSQGKIVTVD